MVMSYEVIRLIQKTVKRSLPPALKKRRKSNLVKLKEQEIFESNQRDESDEND